MTDTHPALRRARFEQFVLGLILGLVAAVIANFAIAVFVDALNLVAYPYNPDGLIVGMVIMSIIGFTAVLSRRPLATGVLSSILLGGVYGAIAWNADRFVELLPITGLVAAMPLVTAAIAGIGARFFIRRVRA